MKKYLAFSILVFISTILFAQTDCSDCPFIYHLSDTEYCSEINVECGETFTLTFNKCPIRDGSDFCSFCNEDEAFLQNFGPNIDVLGMVDNGSSVTYTFRANTIEDGDCYTACLSYWPCGIECEWIGFCYENSLAYHYKINVCGCEPPYVPCDDHRLWDCLSTECECLKICVNNVEVIFNNNTGGEAFICFPDGSQITDVADCTEDLDCGGIIFDDDDKKRLSDYTIPETKIITYDAIESGLDINLELPDSKEPYEVVVSNAKGNIIKKDVISGSNGILQLRNIASGIYFVTIKNSSTSIQHKVFFGN